MNLLLDLQISDKFGAGVAALETVRELLDRPGIRLVLSQPPRVPILDEAGNNRLERVLEWSHGLLEMAAEAPDHTFSFEGSVLLKGSFPFVFDKPGSQFRGTVKTVANYVFEQTQYVEGLRERAAVFDTIICASRWCQDILANHGIHHTALNHQTANPERFRPLPVAKHDRFTIFSGGKFEFRKGQDLVIEAFRQFAKKYSDTQLCLLWNNRWFSQMGEDFAKMKLPSLPKTNRYAPWLTSLGIPADRILEIAEVGNAELPAILNRCHLAVFPSRAEGGTNICAMEAMACGLPVILSKHTGHLDLMAGAHCLSLARQYPVADHPEWGESDIEEMVAQFEHAYHHREAIAQLGRNAREFMSEWTWKRHVDQLLSVCGY